MNKYHKLLSDTVLFGLGSFTTKLIYFFLMPIYTSALSTEDFGFVDLLNNSLQLILPVLTICISDGVFRFTLDKDANPLSLLSNGLRVVIYGVFFMMICGIIMFCLNPHIYWVIFVVLYISESIRSLFAQFVRGLGKVKVYVFGGIISAVSLLISTYILLKAYNIGINGYLISYVIANTLSILFILLFGKVYKYISLKCDVELIQKLITYSLPLVPNMLFWWLTNISSRYIIALYFGLSLSGLFAAASKLPALINIITSVFQLSWQFASVREYQETKQTEFYQVVFKYYSFFVTVAGSFLIALVPVISKFLLKDNFYQAWVFTPLLLFAAMLGCYSTFLGTFYSVIKQNKGIMITTLWGAIVNIVICFGFLPIVGIHAALWGNVLSYGVVMYLRIKDCEKLIGLKIKWINTIVALSIALMQCIIITADSEIGLYISFAIPFIILIFYKFRGITVLKMVQSLLSAH